MLFYNLGFGESKSKISQEYHQNDIHSDTDLKILFHQNVHKFSFFFKGAVHHLDNEIEVSEKSSSL